MSTTATPELVTPPVTTETPSGEPVVAAVVPAVVPEAYDLKWPDGSEANPAIVERTAAIARELGLSNDAGQKLLEQTVEDLAADATTQADTLKTATEQAATDAREALIKSFAPGGDAWKERVAAWETEALKDPDIGGSPEKLTVAIEKGQQALAKYGPELKDYLTETGLGSNPKVIKFLARIGGAMSEGDVPLAGATAPKPKTTAEKFYENGGAGPAPTVTT